MKRIYWLMALAGFVVTPISAILSYLVSDGVSAGTFVLRSYLFALVFFATIVIILAGVRRPEDAHGIGRQFVYSFAAFSVGSLLASVLALGYIALTVTSLHPTL